MTPTGLLNSAMAELCQRDIARRLEVFRCAFRLSGEDAARLAGYGGKTDWSNFESAEQARIPDALNLNRLRDRYGVSLDWFYCGSLVGLADEVKRQLEAAEHELADGKKYRHRPAIQRKKQQRAG